MTFAVTLIKTREEFHPNLVSTYNTTYDTRKVTRHVHTRPEPRQAEGQWERKRSRRHEASFLRPSMTLQLQGDGRSASTFRGVEALKALNH